ncbi:MAG: hypothetical protein KGL91_04095 [Xanthomonadaceae bacterium]|nr:hypothetical protein [Xanthomonadaceae bacterium]
MGKFLAVIAGLLLSCGVLACECAFVPLGTEEAQSAKNVFVFRLMASRVDNTSTEERNSILGTIEVVARIRGSATKVRHVRYSISECCGSRLEVGKYYVAFLPSDISIFDGNGSNLLPLWQGFGQSEANNLEAVLRGKKRLEDTFAFGLQEIDQVRPPPPPCPAITKKSK